MHTKEKEISFYTKSHHKFHSKVTVSAHEPNRLAKSPSHVKEVFDLSLRHVLAESLNCESSKEALGKK